MIPAPGKFFENLRQIDKAYRKFYQQELAAYNFTPNEITVLLFLHNNAPELDTASDIVRCKGVSKGLVARSVDELCRREYLETFRDPDDRRIIHLKLSRKADDIRKKMDEKQSILNRRIEDGIPEDWLRITSDTLQKLRTNAELLIKEDLNYE